MNLPLPRICFTALASGLLLMGTAQAQIIFQDLFAGTGELIGQTPTVTTGGATWAGVAGIYTEGSGLASFSGGSNATGPDFAYLPFAGTNFLDGATYSLSLDVNFTNAPGDRWTGLGFTTGAGGDAFNNGAAWMLNKGTGSDIQFFANNFGQSGTAAGAGASVTTLRITLTLDGSGAGSLNYFSSANGAAPLNAAPLTLTSGQVDSITGPAFFKYHDAAGSYSNLTFAAVPEPATLPLILGGLGMLVTLQRFRMRRA